MKVSINIGKSVLTFLVLLMMPMLASAWQDTNYSYCRNITISSPIAGTYFYELQNSGFNYSHVSNASGYDIRFYNGSCADSGQAEFEYYREDYNPNNNSYFFINMSESTNKIAMYYGYNDSADVSDYSKVFLNDGDVTYATSTGWTEVATPVLPFNKYAIVNTSMKYVQLIDSFGKEDTDRYYGVYSSLKNPLTNESDYAVYYRAYFDTIAQGGGCGVANGNDTALFQQINGSFFGVAYELSNYYLDGWQNGISIETNLAYNSHEIEYYGRLTKHGTIYNLTLASNRNMSGVLASGQIASDTSDNMNYFYPFNSFASGYSANAISGWINQTYVTSYTTETFTTLEEETPTTSTTTTSTTTTSTTTTTITPTTTTIPTGDIISQMSPVISGLLGVFLCLFIAGVFFFMKKSFK